MNNNILYTKQPTNISPDPIFNNTTKNVNTQENKSTNYLDIFRNCIYSTDDIILCNQKYELFNNYFNK